MRGVVVLCLFSACGRIGFDTTDGGTGDAPIVGRWHWAGAAAIRRAASRSTGELWCWGSRSVRAGRQRPRPDQIDNRARRQRHRLEVHRLRRLVELRHAHRLHAVVFRREYYSAIPGARTERGRRGAAANRDRRLATVRAQRQSRAARSIARTSCRAGARARRARSQWRNGRPNGGHQGYADRYDVMEVDCDVRLHVVRNPERRYAVVFGRDSLGQVGENSRTTRLSPVQVGSNRTWIAVATGTDHTCAISKAVSYGAGATTCSASSNGTPTDMLQLVPAPATAVPPLVEYRSDACTHVGALLPTSCCVGATANTASSRPHDRGLPNADHDCTDRATGDCEPRLHMLHRQ